MLYVSNNNKKLPYITDMVKAQVPHKDQAIVANNLQSKLSSACVWGFADGWMDI